MITEDYVSFETAKLLKEKGFEGVCHAVYDKDGIFINLLQFVGNSNFKGVNEEKITFAPTPQMAMKWLREVHNLHCDIGYDDLDWSWNVISVSKEVPAEDRPKVIMNGYACNKTYEEACEAAIKYCLENLI